MKIDKKQLFIILIGAALIFGLFLSNMFFIKKIPLDKMFFVNGMDSEGHISGEDSQTVMAGPYLSLNKGTYNLNLKYTSDVDNKLRITLFKGKMTLTECDMPSEKQNVNLKFELPFDMYDSGIEFVVDYGGEGQLDINSITLSNGRIYYGAIIMFVMYIVLSLLFVLISEANHKEWYLSFYILMHVLLGSLFKENIAFNMLFNLFICYIAIYKSNILKKENTVIYSAIILFAYSVIIFCTKSSPLYLLQDWVDTQSYYTMGKGIFTGKALYKDLFEQKGPFFYLIYGIGYLINTHNLFGAYFMEGIAASVTFLFAYKIANMYLSRSLSLLAVLLLPILIYNGNFMLYGGSCEEFMTAFLMMSFYFFMKIFHENSKNPMYMFANGLLGGIILLMKFNITIFFVGLGVCVYIMNIKEKNYRLLWRNLVYTVLGALTIIMPAGIWLLLSGSLSGFFEVVNFNSQYASFTFDINGMHTAISNIIGSWYDNWFCSTVIIFGIFSFLFIKDFSKKLGGIGLLASFLLISFGAHMNRSYFYYYMVECGFVIFGIISFLYLFEKYHVKIKKELFPVLAVLSVVISVHYNGNYREMKPFIDYVSAQDYFAMIMHTQSDNPTLLNYGFLDGGFYTAADIVPNIRFFQRQNISADLYPLNQEVQVKAMENREVEFVVVRRYKTDGELMMDELQKNYDLLETKDQKLVGMDFTYYLYKTK